MTRRVLTAALAAGFATLLGLTLPAAAAGQRGPLFDQPPAPRLRVIPFAGHLNGFTRQEQWVRTDGGDTTVLDADAAIADATGAGLILDVSIARHLGLAAGVAAYSRGETTFAVAQTGDAFRTDGANLLIGRMGITLRLPAEQSELVLRRLEASVGAGALIYHERLRNRLGTAEVLGDGTHYGINVALNAALPFARDRFAVHVGVEDNVVFWDGASLEPLPRAYLGPGTPQAETSATANVSHSWLLRAGIALRFH